jgi:hypothetical protein
MPQVGVDLVAKGNIASEANKAADAMASLADQEHKVQAIARSLGSTDIKLVGKALDTVAKNEAKAVTERIKGEKAAQAEVDKAAKEKEKAVAKNAAAEKKAHNREVKYARQDLRGLGISLEMQDKILSKVGPEMAGALATGAELAAGVGVALLAAAVAATALGYAISSAALEAGNARDSAQSLMGVLTAGQGEKALKLVDGLAEQLGMRFDVARQAFVDFRKAGLDNKQAAALLKLKADLDAVDSSGKLSAEAVSKVLSHKGKAGTSEEMALLAKQAGVLGNGAKAAEARFTTLGGALASIDNTKTVALQQIFDRISPSIAAAASKVALFLDQFVNSEKGIKLLDKLGDTISWVVDTAVSSLPLIAKTLDGLITAGEMVVNAYNAVADVFATNSTAAAIASAAFTGLKVVGTILVGALALVAGAAAAMTAPLFLAVGAVLAVTGAIASALSYIFNLGSEMAKAGSAIIDGLIGGIMSKIANVKAVIGNLASSISGGFKSALGIASPSKVFAQFGKHTAAGYEQGVDKHMPTGEDFADKVAPGGSAAPVASAGAATTGGGGGVGAGVYIENLVVPVGVEPEPFARAVRRELTLLLQMIQISKGAPA